MGDWGQLQLKFSFITQISTANLRHGLKQEMYISVKSNILIQLNLKQV